MISLINSVFITLLFSVWVWTLKQDIERLNQPASGGIAGAGGDLSHEPPTEPRKQTRLRTESPLYDQHGKRRSKDGVPTWTIA